MTIARVAVPKVAAKPGISSSAAVRQAPASRSVSGCCSFATRSAMARRDAGSNWVEKRTPSSLLSGLPERLARMTRSVSSPTTNSTSIVPLSGRRRSTSARVAAGIRPRQVRSAGSRSKSACCWAVRFCVASAIGSFEPRDAGRVGLGQPALARQLRVHATPTRPPASAPPRAPDRSSRGRCPARPARAAGEGRGRASARRTRRLPPRPRPRPAAARASRTPTTNRARPARKAGPSRPRAGDRRPRRPPSRRRWLWAARRRRRSASASATCARHSTSSFLSASAPRRARPAASSAAACAPLPASARDSPISARAACSARLRPVNASMAFLYEAIPSWNFSCAVCAKASPATALATHSWSPAARQLSTALSILVLGQREAARHQIDERQTLPRAPGM